MLGAVYVLCAVTALWCAVLLLRGYRRTRTRLLLWSGICFAGLALNNLLIYLDLVLLADVIDIPVARVATATASMGVLMYGLVWDTRR